MVRFAIWGEFDYNKPWDLADKPHIGLLVEYDSLSKIATVLFKGSLYNVRAQLVEKAGRKDYEFREKA